MREWLYWYDESGNKYPTPEEVVLQQTERADKLAAKLRELGVHPDEV